MLHALMDRINDYERRTGKHWPSVLLTWAIFAGLSTVTVAILIASRPEHHATP